MINLMHVAIGVLFGWLMFSDCQAGTWVEYDKIAIRDDGTKEPSIYMTTEGGAGHTWAWCYKQGDFAGWCHPPIAFNQWTRIDLKRVGVPIDAGAVDLRGILVLTHGTTAEICGVMVAVRPPGSQMSMGNYIGQTAEADIKSGPRSNMATWANVVDGQMEIAVLRQGGGTYPANCAIAVNLSIQAYVR